MPSILYMVPSLVILAFAVYMLYQKDESIRAASPAKPIDRVIDAQSVAATPVAQDMAPAQLENGKISGDAARAEISKAIQGIRTKVNRSWIRPISMKAGQKCRVRVRLMPDGAVVLAEVIASSGDKDFDLSAKKAVIQASPLPVPRDQELFAKNFRSLTFTFDPDRGR